MPMPIGWRLVTVRVTRPGTKASRGATVADWDSATTRDVGGCWVGNPSTSADQAREGRDANVRATLYAPPGADVMAGDRVTYAGVDYAIDGEPLPYPSPLGGVDHIECPLVDWT